jgi:hypothetical protein
MEISQNNQFLTSVMAGVFDTVDENIQRMITRINQSDYENVHENDLNAQYENYYTNQNTDNHVNQQHELNSAYFIVTNDDFQFDMEIGHNDVFFDDNEDNVVINNNEDNVVINNNEEYQNNSDVEYQVFNTYHFNEVNDGDEENSFMMIDLTQTKRPVRHTIDMFEYEGNHTTENTPILGAIKNAFGYVTNSIMSMFR